MTDADEKNTRRSRAKPSSQDSAQDTLQDVFVAGGGYVGLCVAVSIKSAAPGMRVIVVDAAPEVAIENDTRASAIAAAATRMLDRLGVWNGIVGDAQPINEMIVTDSRLNDVVRPVFLTFGGERAEAGASFKENDGSRSDTPFAHMVPNRSLVKALRAKAKELGVELVNGDSVERFDTLSGHAQISCSSG
ncbi:MAG: FAD-dependent monooxygenase, partial [Pseudomonadota bacterium]